MYPWQDYSGRLSPLKLAVFIALFLPGLWTAIAFGMGWLQPRPFTEAIHRDRGSRLHVLPVGRHKASSKGLDAVIEALAETYDYVVLDAPAVSASVSNAGVFRRKLRVGRLKIVVNRSRIRWAVSYLQPSSFASW